MKSPSAVPKYTLFCFSGDNTVLLNMSVSWHWRCRGHAGFTLQLQGFSSLTSLLITFLLCDFGMLDMFCMQEQLTLTVFLLKIAWSLLDFGKSWYNRFKDRLTILVEIFLLKGGLNQLCCVIDFGFVLCSFYLCKLTFICVTTFS